MAQQTEPKEQKLPNLAVLQAIIHRMEEFEREQMFIVREDPTATKSKKGNQSNGESEITHIETA